MKYSDRGWSPEKFVHRSIFYSETYRLLGHTKFYSNLHVTLTGSGEDNRFLSEFFHVSKNNILSFDIDRDVSSKCLLDGYKAILGDVFKGLPRELNNRPVATFHLDLTGTLPKFLDRIMDLQSKINHCYLMITYNVNRTKTTLLAQTQKKLDRVYGDPILLNHTRYRSMTIDSAGNVKMPRGSTMASVIYKL